MLSATEMEARWGTIRNRALNGALRDEVSTPPDRAAALGLELGVNALVEVLIGLDEENQGYLLHYLRGCTDGTPEGASPAGNLHAWKKARSIRELQAETLREGR